jgi:hypothetical protein
LPHIRTRKRCSLGDHSKGIPKEQHLEGFLKEFDRIFSRGPEYANAYFDQMDRSQNATATHEMWKGDQMVDEGFWDKFNPYKYTDTSAKTKSGITDKVTGDVMFTGSGVTVTRDGDNGIMGCFESESFE